MSAPAMARFLSRKGRGNDTMLAHITPREAKILKAHGGSGTINPETGLPEFDDSWFGSLTDWFTAPAEVPSYTPTVQQPEFTNYAPSGTQPETITATPLSNENMNLMADYQAQVAAGTADPGQTLWASTPDIIAPGLTGSQTQFQGGGDVAGGFVPPENVPLPPPRPDGIGTIDATAATAPASVYSQNTQQQTPSTPMELQQAGTTEGAQAETGAKPTPSIWDKLTSNPLQLALALGGLGIGAYSTLNAKKQAAAQAGAINNVAQQQASLAQPLLTQGGQIYSQAVQGILTPVQRQAFDAARAQLAQAAANTGGVGAMQATVMAENMRQQALQTQLTQGLQLLGQGDSLMNAALATQLQAITSQGQYVTAASNTALNFFGALGKIYGSTV
jgi:hypothetical protein